MRDKGTFSYFSSVTLGIVGLAAVYLTCLAADGLPNWQIGPLVRPQGVNPVLSPRKDSLFECPMRSTALHWESLHTFNPAAIVRNGKIFVIYRAEDDTAAMKIGMHTSRLGLAESDDGLHFTRRPTPVLYPDRDDQKGREWDGGCEDPRIVEAEDGTYVLTYTQWNRERTDAAIATSTDLVHWTKHGPSLGAVPGSKYSTLSYKSAGIVSAVRGDRLIAKKLSGKYWMYWGEGTIRLATSTDLIHWHPVEDSNGEPVVVLAKRPGHFDSSFPEVGPPPVWTNQGIIMLYNGKNAAAGGEPALAADTYSVGEALFDPENPAKILARTEQPVFKPEVDFERSGQYVAGTTFSEGLVVFKGQWFLYYGCADSLVGVATAKSPNTIAAMSLPVQHPLGALATRGVR